MMNEPLIDSSNAKVKTHSSSHCLSITWEVYPIKHSSY